MASVYPEKSNKINNIHRSFLRNKIRNEKYHYKKRYSRSNWKSIKFSPHINLIKKPDTVLSYFNKASKLYKKNINVHYDLTDCIEFSPESIAILTAYISSKKFTNEMGSRGELPKNPFIKQIISQSGFFDYVTAVGRSKPKTTSKMVHKVTNNKVETQEVKDVCLFVKEKVNAEFIDDMEPLYDVLIEAMQNTNNHASSIKNVEYDWWLTRFEDKRDGVLHYSFLDIGVGVFDSLPVQNFLRKAKTILNITSNLDLVDKLVNGEIKSSTGRADRGKGIPQIFELSKDKLFKDFFMLSNDILVDAKTMKKVKLKQEFSGTLYYFTIEIKKYTYGD